MPNGQRNKIVVVADTSLQPVRHSSGVPSRMGIPSSQHNREPEMTDTINRQASPGKTFSAFAVYPDGTILQIAVKQVTAQSVFYSNNTDKGRQENRYGHLFIHVKLSEAIKTAKIRASDNVEKCRKAYENAIRSQAEIELIDRNRMDVI